MLRRLMGGRIAPEGQLLGGTTRQRGCPLIAHVRFLTLIGSGVNFTARRPIERVVRECRFLRQREGLAQCALRITRIGPCERSIDGNHRTGIALIKQIVQPQDRVPIRCRERRGQTVLTGNSGFQVQGAQL